MVVLPRLNRSIAHTQPHRTRQLAPRWSVKGTNACVSTGCSLGVSGRWCRAFPDISDRNGSVARLTLCDLLARIDTAGWRFRGRGSSFGSGAPARFLARRSRFPGPIPPRRRSLDAARIASNDTLAATLRPVVAGLREKTAAVQRAHWHKAHASGSRSCQRRRPIRRRLRIWLQCSGAQLSKPHALPCAA
jgi:hypothetical protein